MKCPNDQSEMEKGMMTESNIWIGEGFRTSMVTSKVIGGKRVWAYKCSKCGKVELTTEVKEEKN